MQTNTQLQPVLESIVTLSDRATIIAVLQKLSQAKYQADAAATRTAIADALPEYFVQPLEQYLKEIAEENLQAELSNAQAQLLSLPLATISVPYIPTRSQLEELHQKLTIKFQSPLVITANQTHKSEFGITIDFAGKRYQKSIQTT